MCQFFSHFFSCNEVSGCLRNDIGMSSESILSPKMGLKCACELKKTCQQKVERKTWANTPLNGVSI